MCSVKDHLYHIQKSRIICKQLKNGIASADRLMPELCAPLFETRDMKRGTTSLLKDGPGKAVFSGT